MAEVKTLKNFLSLALGTVIRKVRNELNLTYNDVAAKTGVKSSYFQAFEQGNAIFHVSKATALYDVFKSFFPNGLRGFIEILSLITILESQGSEGIEKYLKECGEKNVTPTLEGKNKAYKSGLQLALRKLSVSDKKYAHLYHKLIRIILGENNEEILKTIEVYNINLEIISFISDFDNYGNSPGAKIANSLNELNDETPSMHMNFVVTMNENLRMLPVWLSQNTFVNWEISNLDRIEEVTFVMVQEFWFSNMFADTPFLYMFNKHFKKASFFMFNDYGDLNLESFKERLNNIHSHEYKTPLTNEQWDTIKNKLEFKFDIEEEVANKFFTGRYFNVDANFFWIYTLTDKTYAAFSADLHFDENDMHQQIRCLTVGELKDKLVLINDLNSSDNKTE